jgi:hypothetical protein
MLQSSPYRPVHRAAHHDIKLLPMTTMRLRIPHVAEKQDIAAQFSWQAE